MFEHFRGNWAYAGQNLFGELSKIFFFVHFGTLRWDLDSLSKFGLIIVEICIIIWYFWVISKNYSMWMLSIRGNNFIAHWAYEEMISSHTESTPWELLRILSQQKNINNFYMYIHGEHTRKWFHRTLSIQGNDLNPGWASAEMSLHPEHMRKSNMSAESNMIFKKSRVTSFWDQKVSVSVKKSFNKISCMCTFKRHDRILNGRVGKGYPKPDKLETGFGKQKDKVLNHQWWHLFLISICYF